jgi:Mor family transcriptional regulator
VAHLIGVEAAVRLAEEMGGAHLYIPQADSALAAARRAWILANRNLSPRELSRATGYSERQVYRILETQEEDERQGGLF